MDSCPFCGAEVEEELVLYGGTCPHCLNPIPGEEAPTDPGAQAIANAEVEAMVAQQSTSSRTPLFAAAAALLCAVVLGGGYYYSTTLPADVPGELPEIRINRDLSAHVNLGSPEDAAKEDAASASGGATGSATGRPPQERAVAAVRTPSPPTGGSVDATASSDGPAQSNLGPPRPSALGEFDIGAGPSIGGVGLPAAKVLTSPDEIDQMVARSISARGRQVTACYESRLKTVEDLAGIWSISFVVNPDGTTSGVKVKGQSARDDTLESCLKRKVSGWRFQKIAKPHPVTVPFNFSPT